MTDPLQAGQPANRFPFKTAWLLAVTVLFVVACFLPVTKMDIRGLYQGSEEFTIRGYHCLVPHPLVLMFPAWYGNIVLMSGVAVAACGGEKELAVFAGLAVALISPSWLLHSQSDHLFAGYWVWLSAYVVFLVGSLWFHVPRKKAPGHPA